MTSIFLQSGPEIKRHVYSFLSLQESLVLRNTCHQLSQDTNVLQYSCIVKYVPRRYMSNHQVLATHEKAKRQEQFIINLRNMDHLRSILHNENLKGAADNLLHALVEYSTTDNADAASVLLHDGRPTANVELLETAIKKGFTSIAAMLQQDARVRPHIHWCNNHGHLSPGVYRCFRGDDCCEPDWKYCRDCVDSSNRLCSGCHGYLCRSCYDTVNYTSCDECNTFYCRGFYNDECDSDVEVVVCDCCGYSKCWNCIEGGWDVDAELCPDCAPNEMEDTYDDYLRRDLY